MLLEPGEKIHVIERRLFDGDVRRHFLGAVDEASDVAVRVTGYSFVFNLGATEFVRRAGVRTRIIALDGPTFIINVLPGAADLGSARYELDDQNHLVLTDGSNFSLDINEFGPLR